MKTKFLLTTAALALTASIAVAQSVAEQAISQLQAQGFTRIEVKQGPSQVKIEAIRGRTEVEFVYDLATGALLSREIGTVDAGDDTRPGIEFDREDEDFVFVRNRAGGSPSYDDDYNDGIDNDRYHDDDDDDDNDGIHNDRYDDDDDDDDRGGRDDDRDDDDDDDRGSRDDDRDDDDDDDHRDRDDDDDDDDDDDRHGGRDDDDDDDDDND